MIISLEIALAPGEPRYQPSPGEEIEVQLTNVVIGSYTSSAQKGQQVTIDLRSQIGPTVPIWRRVRYLMTSAGAIFVEPLEPLSSRTLVCSVTGIRPIASPESAVEIL